MDELSCPRCRTTKYRNPSLKLLVNVCGHSLCDHCVDLLFVRGTGQCPECGIALKRSNYKLQLFEDSEVQKEVDIRKKILKDYNKREEDFETLREYNDYLEDIESIVFNLAYGVEVEETKKKVEQYKKENKDQIRKNQAKLSKDQEYLEELLEEEKRNKEIMNQLMAEEEGVKHKHKVKDREALIDELMFSDMPADQILDLHKKQMASKEEQQEQEIAVRRERITQFSSGITVGKKDTGLFLPVPTRHEAPCYEYEESELDMCGPPLPDVTTLLQQGYLNHVRGATEQEKAGGFETFIFCQRAMQDAFSGLYCEYVPKTDLSVMYNVMQPMDMEIDPSWD